MIRPLLTIAHCLRVATFQKLTLRLTVWPQLEVTDEFLLSGVCTTPDAEQGLHCLVIMVGGKTVVAEVDPSLPQIVVYTEARKPPADLCHQFQGRSYVSVNTLMMLPPYNINPQAVRHLLNGGADAIHVR